MEEEHSKSEWIHGGLGVSWAFTFRLCVCHVVRLLYVLSFPSHNQRHLDNQKGGKCGTRKMLHSRHSLIEKPLPCREKIDWQEAHNYGWCGRFLFFD